MFMRVCRNLNPVSASLLFGEDLDKEYSNFVGGPYRKSVSAQKRKDAKKEVKNTVDFAALRLCARHFHPL